MIPATSFVGLAAVAAIAVVIPLALGLLPRLRLPAVVIELVAGIVIGPFGIGLVHTDDAIRILALLGLAFLLFLGGLEIDVSSLHGRLLEHALLGFGVSLALGLVVGLVLGSAGLVGDPLLVAIILLATSLGVVVPVLKDSGVTATPFGQRVIASCSVADFGAIVLLSLFFSGQAEGAASQAALLLGFALTAILAAVLAARAEHVARLSGVLRLLQDTTAQIRVRLAFLLLVAFVALAQAVGLEVILGAFLAGMVVSAIDRDDRMTHPLFRPKLEAIGFGVFIPVFFVASGMDLDVRSLVASASSLALVPIFLAALLLVRGLPALLDRGSFTGRQAVAAGLLQATSLPFIVAATRIGSELGLLRPATATALVAAGLLSVLLFPVSALTLLRGASAPGKAGDGVEATIDTHAMEPL